MLLREHSNRMSSYVVTVLPTGNTGRFAMHLAFVAGSEQNIQLDHGAIRKFERIAGSGGTLAVSMSATFWQH
jgi:hypothetical protein